MTQCVSATLSRTKAVVAARVEVAASLPQRMQGLLGRPALEAGAGLFLPACRSIHTCGMRFSLDVIFLTRQGQVVAALKSLPPWRISPLIWRAWGVLELPDGTVERHNVLVGDQLELRELP